MRIAIGFLCFSSLAIACWTQSTEQTQGSPAQTPVQVRTLTIVSNDLSQDLRQHIVLAYQGRTYPLDELEERIRQGLRDLGYAEASVEIPQLASMPPVSQGQPVDVTVQVTAGAIYRLDAIVIEGNVVMPKERILEQFPVRVGDIFKASAIGKGLGNLGKLYFSRGYIDFGAIPTIQEDETQRTIALTIDIDEGRRFSFGRLLLDGVEPHAGAAKELLAAWSSMEGKTYDPKLLAQWLAVNATFLPGVAAAPDKAEEKYVTLHQDPDNRRVDIELHLP